MYLPTARATFFPSAIPKLVYRLVFLIAALYTYLLWILDSLLTLSID